MIRSTEFNHHLESIVENFTQQFIFSYIQRQHGIPMFFAVNSLRIHPIDIMKIIHQLKSQAERNARAKKIYLHENPYVFDRHDYA